MSTELAPVAVYGKAPGGDEFRLFARPGPPPPPGVAAPAGEWLGVFLRGGSIETLQTVTDIANTALALAYMGNCGDAREEAAAASSLAATTDIPTARAWAAYVAGEVRLDDAPEEAATLLRWSRHLRHESGAYWTGCVHPQCVNFPGGERSTYTAAAVVLAADVLCGRSPTSGLFRGETLPAVPDLSEDAAVAPDERA